MASLLRLIRAAIFDWGGVLVRTDLHGALSRWDERLGTLPGTVLTAVFGGTDDTVLVGKVAAEEHWRTICRAVPLSAEQHRELTNDLEASEVFDTELAEFVRGLRPRLRTALLTNQWSDGRKLMNRHGAEQLVDELIISAEVASAKPHPRIYEIALERLGVRPQEAIFVDDSENNIATASALGFECVLYQTTPQTITAVRGLL